MKKLIATLTLLWICAMAHAAADPSLPKGFNVASRPNIVIIFNDDMGYADLGCFGSEKNKTPCIDKMAEEGCKFTDFYVTSSVCTPSRASLMTGCYPVRVLGPSGVFFPNKVREAGMDPRHFTIAELLKSVGYKTLHAGKWHLGDAVKFLPTRQGFDTFYGIPYSNGMYPSRSMKYAADCNFREGFSAQKIIDLYAATPAGAHPKGTKHKVPLMRDEECIEFPLDQTTITRRLADESIRFIKESVKAKKPFFVYLANPMPHVPLFVSPEFEGKTGNGLYSDVIAELDFNTGRVMDALKANGVDENTLVIFTSDNGPWLIKGEHSGSAKPLRAGKGSSYEGGHRVPCIMRWPAKIPAGTVCSEVATAMDMMPTFAVLTGARIPSDIRCEPDGHNIENLMTGGSEEKSPYEAFYMGGAVREGKWKYRRGPLYAKWSAPGTNPKDNPGVTQLFNLAEDPGESNNVIDQYPEVAARMSALLPLNPNVSMVVSEPAPPNGTRYSIKKGVAIEVDGGEGGTFEAVIAFATKTGSTCAILVNGVEQEALGFPNVKSWSKKKTGKVTLILKPGKNTIEIQPLSKRGINFGYIDLKAK